jgi:hypothetical protein
MILDADEIHETGACMEYADVDILAENGNPCGRTFLVEHITSRRRGASTTFHTSPQASCQLIFPSHRTLQDFEAV